MFLRFHHQMREIGYSIQTSESIINTQRVIIYVKLPIKLNSILIIKIVLVQFTQLQQFNVNTSYYTISPLQRDNS